MSFMLIGESSVLTLKAAEEVASGICGDNMTWTLDSDGVLTISGTGDMYTYEYTADTAKHPTYSAYDSVIQKVVIEENVTSLSPYAFICYYSVDYNKLTEVEIKSKSMTEIPMYCFNGCESLSTVKLPDQITVIGSSSFSSCPITTINMPSQLEIIGAWAFCGSRFTTLEFPYGLKKISKSAFESSKIEEVVIPETVTTIGEEAFYYSNVKILKLHDKGLSIGLSAFDNSKLEELTLPANVVCEYDSSTGKGYNFANTPIKKLYIEEGVEYIVGGAFSSCKQLEEVHLSSTVKIIDDVAFFGCKNLKSINIENVRYIGTQAFSNCEKCDDLKGTLELSPNLMKLGYDAFQGTGVRVLIVPKTFKEFMRSYGIISGGNYRHSGIEEYVVDPENPYYSSKDGILYDKQKTYIINYPGLKTDPVYVFPKTIKRTWDSYDASEIVNNGYLKTLIYPDDIALEEIDALTHTNMGNYNRDINTSIETIILPNKPVKINRGAFRHLKGLKVVYIPDAITEFDGNIKGDYSSPDFVIYCHSGSAAEQYAKNNNYRYKLVDDVRIDNAFFIFPDEVIVGGIKNVSLEIIGDVDLSGKEITFNSTDETVYVLKSSNTENTINVSFIPSQLGEHSINMVIDGETYTFDFEVVQKAMTGNLGKNVKVNANRDGVFVPRDTDGDLYDDSVYAEELENWISRFGYEDLFADYLEDHSYEDLVNLEISMPITDVNGNEYLWTNTKITVKQLMTYIIFMDNNKEYLEEMEKSIAIGDYYYQGRIYSLDYHTAYDSIMNLYTASCELEMDLTGKEEMMKYLSILTYGIVVFEEATGGSALGKGYSYVKKLEKIQIEGPIGDKNDYVGYILSGGDTDNLAYGIREDVEKVKEDVKKGKKLYKIIKKQYDWEAANIYVEREVIPMSPAGFVPILVETLEYGEYVNQEFESEGKFIDTALDVYSFFSSIYNKPLFGPTFEALKLTEKYLAQVKGIFEDAEKQDAGWYVLVMYYFNQSPSKLEAYIDLQTLDIKTIFDSNLNFSANDKIEEGIAKDYESKYYLGDGSFVTLPNDSKVVVLGKAANLANRVKTTDAKAKAEELLQHLVAQIDQDKYDIGEVKNTTSPSENDCNANLVFGDENLILKIGFDDDERIAIGNGEDIDVYLVVRDANATVSDDEKNSINGVLTIGMEVGMYLDIEMFKKIGDNLPSQITATQEDMTIKLTIPDHLLNTNPKVRRTFYIIRSHDGKLNRIYCTFDKNTNELSFKTDKFSTYAIVYKDVDISGGNNTPGGPGGGNNTSDDDDDDTNTPNPPVVSPGKSDKGDISAGENLVVIEMLIY